MLAEEKKWRLIAKAQLGRNIWKYAFAVNSKSDIENSEIENWAFFWKLIFFGINLLFRKNPKKFREMKKI